MTEMHWSEAPAGTRVTLELWVGVLLAPLAWATNLLVNYALATVACGASPALAHIVTAAALALAVAGAALSWRNHRRLRSTDSPDQDRRERRRFMAWGGATLSLLFGLAIVAQWIPLFVLRPCE